jgi:hypothetical protein
MSSSLLRRLSGEALSGLSSPIAANFFFALHPLPSTPQPVADCF